MDGDRAEAGVGRGIKMGDEGNQTLEEDGYPSDEDGIGEGWHGGDRDANGHATECSSG